MAANPFHGYDVYREDKERAAKERAEWLREQPRKGPRQPSQFRKGGLARRKPRPVTLAKVGK